MRTGHTRAVLAIISGIGCLIVLFGLLAATPHAQAAANAACVPGPHTGSITGTQDWCPENNPHILSGAVIVPAGMTLTVRPGVIVQANSGTRLQVSGYIDASGTVAEPITFTSSTDSGPGQWAGFYVASGGRVDLLHATVRYAGQFNTWGYAAVNVAYGTANIESSQILSSANAAMADQGVHLCCGSAQATISDTLFAGIGNDAADFAVYQASNGDMLTVTNSVFQSNSGYPINTQPANLVWISGNTFDGNGTNRILIYGGVSGGARAGALMTAQSGLEAYEISNGALLVPAGVTVTVSPGVAVLARANSYVRVEGRLDAIGTAAEPITFTSAVDGGPGEWAGFYVNSGELNIQHTTVRYAGQYNGWGRAAINVAHGAANIESSQILSSASVGNVDYGVNLCCGSARATINNTLFADLGDTTADFGALAYNSGDVMTVTNSTFQNIAGYPLNVNDVSLYGLSNNTFSGNTYDRILIDGQTTFGVPDGTVLARQTGLQAYELGDVQLLVPVSTTLTVEPGVTVMGRSGSYVRVEGQLNAIGTAAEPITFTSATDLGPGQWAGMYIINGSADFNYATIRYAGQSNGFAYSGLTIHSNPAARPVHLINSRVVSNSLAANLDYGLYATNGRIILDNTLFDGNGDSLIDYDLFAANSSVITATHTIWHGNAGRGLGLSGGQAALTCSTVADHGSDGVYLSGGAAFTSLSSGFYGNAGAGITSTSSVTATATYNWWGDATGPGGVGPGSGDEVSTKVTFDPWLPREECTSDLALTRSAVPASVIAGTQLTYTLSVTNAGPGDATGVILSDTLPTGQNFVGGTVSQGSGCSVANGAVSCNVGALPIDSSATATITVAIDPTARGQLVNLARAGGAQTDHQPLNNTAGMNITVQADVDLAIGLTASPNPFIQQPITYTLTISATGLSAGLNVIVTDTLPTGVTGYSPDCAVTGNVAVCTPGNIAPGGVVQSTLVVTPTAAGDLLNHVEMTGADVEVNVANNTVDLTLVVQDYRLYLPLIRR